MRVPAVLVALALACCPAPAQSRKWVTVWTGSAQGPYPVGNASAQPDLRFVFPSAETGARDQTFRLIVQPDLWSTSIRLRFSNAMGARPVTFDGVFAGLQWSAAAVVAGTNRPVRFGGKPAVTIAPGEEAWSDAVALPFVRDPAQAELAGRKLAVSFHVVGESGPMTWHAKALTTSYVTAPGSRIERPRRGRSGIPLQHHLLVFSGCRGRDGARFHPRRGGAGRFHHRWH